MNRNGGEPGRDSFVAHRGLKVTVAALDDAQLAQLPSMDLPEAKTVADQVALVAFRDSHHLGQMGPGACRVTRTKILASVSSQA